MPPIIVKHVMTNQIPVRCSRLAEDQGSQEAARMSLTFQSPQTFLPELLGFIHPLPHLPSLSPFPKRRTLRSRNKFGRRTGDYNITATPSFGVFYIKQSSFGVSDLMTKVSSSLTKTLPMVERCKLVHRAAEHIVQHNYLK